MTAHQTVALKELCCNPGRFIPSVLRQIDWMLLCGSSVFALQNWLSQQFSLPFQLASNRSPSLAKIQFNILIRRHNTFLKSRHFHLSFFFFFTLLLWDLIQGKEIDPWKLILQQRFRLLLHLCMAVMVTLKFKCHLCEVHPEGVRMWYCNTFRIVLDGQIMTSLSQKNQGLCSTKMAVLFNVQSKHWLFQAWEAGASRICRYISVPVETQIHVLWTCR